MFSSLFSFSFSITNELVQPFLGGMTFEQAREDQRLFIVDYTIVDGIKHQKGFYVCNFYSTSMHLNPFDTEHRAKTAVKCSILRLVIVFFFFWKLAFAQSRFP